MAGKKVKDNASAWEKLSSRGHDETLANRDVFSSQQLDRSKIEQKQTKTSRTIVAVVVSVLVFALSWVALSAVQAGVSQMSSLGSGNSKKVKTDKDGNKIYEHVADVPPFAVEKTNVKVCWVQVDAEGYPVIKDREVREKTGCYPNAAAVPEPKWHADAVARAKAYEAAHTTADDGKQAKKKKSGPLDLGGAMADLALWKLLLSLAIAAGVGGTLYQIMMRNLESQNLMKDTSDINQHAEDQHIALPDEIVRKFDWFPDVGALSSVEVSSMISHVMLDKKGIKNVDFTQRATKDILDEDGDPIVHKGDPIVDDSGEMVTKKVPLIDEAFGQALFDASGLPKEKSLRRLFDATTIPYNPGNANRDKLKGPKRESTDRNGKKIDKGGYHTVADMINADWELPWYEPQRPAGAYIVDTAPVNTMVLAITRAGKGQTVIEPTVDMWMREKNPSNMVINDPKGELLVKNYVRATLRGFQVVQFNLINEMKTDIYNPLGMAAEAAREGDSTKCALYVENIADVFFPTDGGEDPVWPNAANNAFKRAAYGLIDYYLEEERELRESAARENMDASVLETKLDTMWGKVTLYNCYQLFVQLTAKKLKNPVSELVQRQKGGEFDEMGFNAKGESLDDLMEEAEAREFLWDGKPEADLLSLYFSATEALPENSMRKLIANANNALKAMAGAEKMLASVYGIAITAMSFFADPTISTLTSGTPSQNTDLGGLSFPRRMGVRLAANYIKRDHLVGAQAKWDAFGDPMFTQNLGKDFEHEDIVNRGGWARYYFKGVFPEKDAYLRLRLVNPQTQMLVRTFYFHFRKSYQTTLNGRHYITDPITDKKIFKNGILTEMKPFKDPETGKLAGFKDGHTTFKQPKLVDVASGTPRKISGRAHAIISTMVRYSEQPKAVFLVTPPHLMKYAKLVLILIKQLVDLNFDKSYMTKSNQKPLYRTRFMLDELGNLQSEGHGISGFETMLSIGLGQEQQFTLILQTLQQLRDVYGESVDKIVQGNAQPLDAKIATPDGWIEMGDVEVGTEVLVPDGGTAFVDGVFPKGVRPVYEVIRADGASTEAADEHLWEVEIELPEGFDMADLPGYEVGQVPGAAMPV